MLEIGQQRGSGSATASRADPSSAVTLTHPATGLHRFARPFTTSDTRTTSHCCRSWTKGLNKDLPSRTAHAVWAHN